MKLLIKLAVLFILGVVALGVAGYFLVPPAANKAVDEGSRYAFGVPAEIGAVKASPGLGTTSIGFEGYVLSSPEGFEEPLLSIGEFEVGVGTSSIIGSTKDVDAFVLDGVRLTLVHDGDENNLFPVLKHLKGLIDGAGSDDEVPAPDGSPREGSAGPKLRLGDVRIEGISATLKLRGIMGIEPYEGTFEVPAYTANLSDFTGSEGKTVAEIAATLIDDMKERALTSAEGIVPDETLVALRLVLDGGLEGGLQGVIDTAKDAATDAVKEKANEVIDDAKEKAGGVVDDALKGVTDDGAKKVDEVLGGDAAKKATDDVKKNLKGLLGGDGE